MSDPLQRLADNIALLTRPTTSTVEYTRAPGTGADGVRRRTPEHSRYVVRLPGLLVQLEAALLFHKSAPAADGSGRGKPRSTEPGPALITGTLRSIAHDAEILRNHLRYVAKKPHMPRPAITANLDEIRQLAHALRTPYAEVAARKTGEWVHRARVALTHEPPPRTLQDYTCRYCNGPLQVPSDASGPVRCVTPGCVDEGGNRPVWPPDIWHLLLIEAEEGAA